MTAAPAPVPAPAAGTGRLAGRSAHWFPLALFGALIALSVPLSATPLARGWTWYESSGTDRSLSWPSSGSGDGSSFFVMVRHTGGGPYGVTGGWYWAVALAAGFLLTAAWYRRRARGSGARAPGTWYLAAGLALAVIATAAPAMLAWHASPLVLFWLTGPWASATFAIPVIAAALVMPAVHARSRALGFVALAYTAVALLVDWPAIRAAWSARRGDPVQALTSMSAQPPLGYAAILLPALVLLTAAAVLRYRRPAGPAEPSDDR